MSRQAHEMDCSLTLFTNFDAVMMEAAVVVRGIAAPNLSSHTQQEVCEVSQSGLARRTRLLGAPLLPALGHFHPAIRLQTRHQTCAL